jgi:hypothetical protein
MICMRAFGDEPRFAIPFNAAPADFLTFGADPRTWEAAYAALGVPLPSLRMPTGVSDELAPPYFNAGFIAVSRATGLGEAWAECCRRIYADDTLPEKGVYADQISLAIAVQQLRLPYDTLERRYNYPLRPMRLPARDLPFFCHYHGADVVRREPVVRDLMRALGAEHDEMADLIAAQPQWVSLVGSRGAPPQRSVTSVASLTSFQSMKSAWSSALRHLEPVEMPELIITGIPRSGSSYLCNLIHRYSNCVVLNEPTEIYPSIQWPWPWGVAAFYRDVRADVIEGKPVRNKLVNGRVTEDTKIVQDLHEYIPRVAGANFVLGTKNPLAYLARLDGLHAVMPLARIVVCVRNPFDTIASWKGSFAHLAAADFSSTPFGWVEAPWLTARERATLTDMTSCHDLAQRRALAWRFLAQLILDRRDWLIVVKYPDLVTRPQVVVQTVLRGYPKGRLREPIRPSAERAQRHLLDEADMQAIRAICSQTAAELGVYSPVVEDVRGDGLQLTSAIGQSRTSGVSP